MGSTAQYGCTVHNRFAFTVDSESDEEDPFESLKKLEVKKNEEKEKSTLKAKELKDAKNKAVKKEAEDAKNSQNKEETVAPAKEGSAKPARKPSTAAEGVDAAPGAGRGGPRGRGRGGPRGSGSARGGRGNQENNPPAEDGAPAAPTGEGVGGEVARGRGRGRGEFRGGRGPRGGGRGRGFAGGNRDFDRQSADPKSSAKPTDKREGGGRGNWGADKDAIEDATATVAAAEGAEAEATEVVVAEAAPAEAAEAAPEVEAEKEPEEMTLDEWRALQTKPSAEFNLRRAGEGCDDSQWKTMVALKKKDDESDESDEDDDKQEGDEAEKKAKKKTGKQVLDIKFEFADPPQRGGRGRGFAGGRGGRGRGEGRGRGRGGEGRGARGSVGPKGDTIMEIDNQKEFPSLGGAPKVVAAPED